MRLRVLKTSLGQLIRRRFAFAGVCMRRENAGWHCGWGLSFSCRPHPVRTGIRLRRPPLRRLPGRRVGCIHRHFRVFLALPGTVSGFLCGCCAVGEQHVPCHVALRLRMAAILPPRITVFLFRVVRCSRFPLFCASCFLCKRMVGPSYAPFSSRNCARRSGLPPFLRIFR